MIKKGYFLLLLDFVSIIVIAWEDENERSFYWEREGIKRRREGETISVARYVLFCVAQLFQKCFFLLFGPRAPRQNLVRKNRFQPTLPQLPWLSTIEFFYPCFTRIYSIAKRLHNFEELIQRNISSQKSNIIFYLIIRW